MPICIEVVTKAPTQSWDRWAVENLDGWADKNLDGRGKDAHPTRIIIIMDL